MMGSTQVRIARIEHDGIGLTQGFDIQRSAPGCAWLSITAVG
jgi:hypothetical protein